MWKDVGPFDDGLALVKDANDKWGFIDKTGRLIIPCMWEWAGHFREGLAPVMEANHNYHYIDKTGKVVK